MTGRVTERYLRRTGGRTGDYSEFPIDPLHAGQAVDPDELDRMSEQRWQDRRSESIAETTRQLEWLESQARYCRRRLRKLGVGGRQQPASK